MTENNISDPDYERDAYGLLNVGAHQHSTIEALLGIAYELRIANLLALDHTLWLLQQEDALGDDGEELLTEVSTQILERLGLGIGSQPRLRTPPGGHRE